MRHDQLTRLISLEEKLVDMFLEEADPQQWSGAGIQIAAMDKQTRGDRYWCKRNAAATGALAVRVADMIIDPEGKPASGSTVQVPADGSGEDQLEAEIVDAERQAEMLMAKMTKMTKGKVHRLEQPDGP